MTIPLDFSDDETLEKGRTQAQQNPPSAQKLFGFFGDEPVGRAIDDAFGKMEVAEEMIDTFQDRHPERADAIDDSFWILKPGSLLTGVPEAVYRGHVRELLTRVSMTEADTEADAQATAVATDAECLMALSETSLQTPLPRKAKWAFAALIESVFPDGAAPLEDMLEDGGLPTPSSEWETRQRDRQISDIRATVTESLDRP